MDTGSYHNPHYSLPSGVHDIEFISAQASQNDALICLWYALSAIRCSHKLQVHNLINKEDTADNAWS